LGDRNDRKKPELINFSLPIKDIKCGNYHTLVLTQDGDVYTSGYNFYGQLGLGHNDSQDILRKVVANFKIERIFRCSAHTLLLSTDNELYGSGYNGTGQLGLGTFEEKVTSPTKATKFTNHQIRDVACRFGNHSFVVTEQNELFATGKNDSGQVCQN
jgi:alpha-tubulin suppressor-like RCC1 family protein